MVAIDTGAQQGCGCSWPDASSRGERGRYACCWLEEGGCMSEGVGDELRLDSVPFPVIRMRVVVHVQRGIGCRFVLAQVATQVEESFGGAELWVVVGALADGFASHGILLVGEGEGGTTGA